jgi:uncharacterized protein (DUF3084 family)
MTFIAGLVGLLVLISGVIAFAGDRLGTWVGRRRLTLFGARPKLTGQIVGVSAGILIMLSTLGVLSLAFRNATSVLLDAQRVATELQALQSLERSLRGELEVLSRQQVDLQEDLDGARVTIDRAEVARDLALADRDRLLAETRALEAELEGVESALFGANARLAQFDVEIAAVEQALAVAELALGRADAQRIAAVIERELAQVQVNELVGQIDVLVSQAQELEGLAGQLMAEAERLQGENVGLAARNNQLAAGNSELLERNVSLVALNASLQAQILAGNDQVAALQSQVGSLTTRLEEEARRLAELQLEFARVASGEVTFVRDQVIFSGALYAKTLEGAREELAGFVRSANASIALRGAGELELTPQQFEGLARAVVETDGSDLVRFISPRNQFDPLRVAVIIEAVENERIFGAGQLLLSRSVHVGTSDMPASLEDIRAAIAQLRGDTIRFLRRSGLDELQVPRFTGVSEEAFANQLLRLDGAVVIGVVTITEIDRAGPALVEYIILY